MDPQQRRAQLARVVAENIVNARFDLGRVQQLLDGSPREATLLEACTITAGVAKLLREMADLQRKLTGEAVREAIRPRPTSGEGSRENPWQSPSGTGGFQEAIDALEEPL